jgi:hypothetical protein
MTTLSPIKKFRRLSAAEIVPDTFNLPMYAYFTAGNETYFLLRVTVVGYPGANKEIKVMPVGVANQFESDQDRGIWLPVCDVWIEDKEAKAPRQYLKPISSVAQVMTVAEWTAAINLGVYTELDGIGRWCKDGKEHSDEVFESPSEDATHVAWYPNE